MKVLLAALAAAGLLSAADQKLGKRFDIKEPVQIAALLAHPGDYEGKTVQVKGKVVEVCGMMGCWMDLTNLDGQKIRIKVDDGVIVFPKDSVGKNAIAQGKFTKIELSREEAVEMARESAKDSGKKFDPDSVKSGATIYQIQGEGAVVLAN